MGVNAGVSLKRSSISEVFWVVAPSIASGETDFSFSTVDSAPAAAQRKS